MEYINSREFAQELDRQDPLAGFRDRFHHPQVNGKTVLYFAGNSPGLMPKSASSALKTELKDWAELTVEGHFKGTNPWCDYHTTLTPLIADIVGAKDSEAI